MKGLVVVELHQSASELSGNATVNNSPLPPDEPCSGTVNGSTIQFGIVGHVDYTGTLSGASASGTFTDHDTSTGGTWSIHRYMDPFDRTVSPVDVSGSWTAVSHSTGSGTDRSATLQVYQSVHDLFGTITQGGTYPILAGHVAGTNVWYASLPDSNTLVVAYGGISGSAGSGGWVQYNTYAATNPEDQGTWTATK